MNMQSQFPEAKAPHSALSQRALLATLRVKAWTARKKDAAATAETGERYNAEEGAIAVSKKLVNCDEYDAIGYVTKKIRDYHQKMTLPWSDAKGAPRILAVQAYPEYTNTFREKEEEHADKVAAFVRAFPGARRAAKQLLGSMWHEDDYPDDIESRFAVAVDFSPVPDKRDWRVDLGDDDVAILRADVERQASDALNGAVKDAYERVGAVVGKMATTLRAYGADDPHPERRGRGRPRGSYFQQSLVAHVADLAKILPLLNVTQDPRLDELARRMVEELTHVEATELMEYRHLRNEVAGNAEAILADIAGFMA